MFSHCSQLLERKVGDKSPGCGDCDKDCRSPTCRWSWSDLPRCQPQPTFGDRSRSTDAGNDDISSSHRSLILLRSLQLRWVELSQLCHRGAQEPKQKPAKGHLYFAASD